MAGGGAAPFARPGPSRTQGVRNQLAIAVQFTNLLHRRTAGATLRRVIIPSKLGAQLSIPYIATVCGGGSVQQGLSAAGGVYGFFEHGSAADKRYSLKLFMSFAFFITVVAASVGLLSGLWLCYPTAAQNPHSLAWVANPPYKSAEGMTALAIAQSAQYSVGGLLLVFAFVLQVLAVLAPQATIQAPNPILQTSLYVVAAIVALVSLIVLAPLSFVAYKWRVKAMHKQVRAAAEHLKQYPRLTPLP